MSTNNGGNLDFEEALIIGAGILGALMFFVVLRFGFNICIDVCILNESDRARRSIVELWRKVCPWWHRRTQPEAGVDEVVAVEQSVELQGTMVLSEDRSALLDTILTSRKVTAEDVKLWKDKFRVADSAELQLDDEEASRSTSGVPSAAAVCSICLLDMEVGDVYSQAKCGHVHHRHCIHSWLCSRRSDCPYCRTEIVSPIALNTILNSSPSST